MTPIREWKRRMKGREMFRKMSMVDRMACTQDLPHRKGKGDQAETRPGGVRRLGELRLPERRARLAASSLSAGDVAVATRSGCRSAAGKLIASEPDMS